MVSSDICHLTHSFRAERFLYQTGITLLAAAAVNKLKDAAFEAGYTGHTIDRDVPISGFFYAPMYYASARNEVVKRLEGLRNTCDKLDLVPVFSHEDSQYLNDRPLLSARFIPKGSLVRGPRFMIS
jgi:hypothetical protein